MWQKLVRTYAVRSREYAEAVARLGSCAKTDTGFSDLLNGINQRRRLCDAAADKLNRYVDSHAAAASTALKRTSC